LRNSSRDAGSATTPSGQTGDGMQRERCRPMRFANACTALVLALSVFTGCAAEDEEDVVDSSSEIKAKKKAEKKDVQRFDVLAHNIGGGAENDPGTKGLAFTLSQIDARNPDVVMLEEVCQSQYEAFKARYPTWNVFFAPMRASHPGCANAEAKGQVLASPRAMTEEIRKDLGDPDGDKQFTLLCGAVRMPDTARKVLACVTHLRAHDTPEAHAARARQAQRIHGLVKDRVAGGQAVVLAGDFNASPHRDTLDPLYRLGRDGNFNGGLFDEADQSDPRRANFAREGVRCAADACRSGEATMVSNGSKLDHVFFSRNRMAGDFGADVLGNGGSGHHLYSAWADLKL
jgi:endonuclease/exonuclease/phosphatase family metal-dependent hydrolase